jgi:hypothetical protein
MASPEPATQSGTPQQPSGQQPQQAIDVKQLAERVYRLMLADLRLQQARDGRTNHKRR